MEQFRAGIEMRSTKTEATGQISEGSGDIGDDTVVFQVMDFVVNAMERVVGHPTSLWAHLSRDASFVASFPSLFSIQIRVYTYTESSSGFFELGIFRRNSLQKMVVLPNTCFTRWQQLGYSPTPILFNGPSRLNQYLSDRDTLLAPALTLDDQC
jgi:hypothetical protein